MTTIIRSIHEPASSKSALPSGIADDVVFHHPFLNAAVHGRHHFERLWSELAQLAGPVAFTHEFQGEDGAGLVWSANFADLKLTRSNGRFRYAAALFAECISSNSTGLL
jgi:hypothetical protein